MKVYVLVGREAIGFSDDVDVIEGVYSSREAAIESMERSKKRKLWAYCSYDIEEHFLDGLTVTQLSQS